MSKHFAPTHAGVWWHKRHPTDDPFNYYIQESPTMGRYCYWLKQGGCAQMGYSDWSGQWFESWEAAR